MTRYTIKLSQDEVIRLRAIINKGSHSSKTYRTAYVLLNCDVGDCSGKVTNGQASKALKAGMRTIDRVKKRFMEEGLEAVLERRKSSRISDAHLNYGIVGAALLEMSLDEQIKIEGNKLILLKDGNSKNSIISEISKEIRTSKKLER